MAIRPSVGPPKVTPPSPGRSRSHPLAAPFALTHRRCYLHTPPQGRRTSSRASPSTPIARRRSIAYRLTNVGGSESGTLMLLSVSPNKFAIPGKMFPGSVRAVRTNSGASCSLQVSRATPLSPAAIHSTSRLTLQGFPGLKSAAKSAPSRNGLLNHSHQRVPNLQARISVHHSILTDPTAIQLRRKPQTSPCRTNYQRPEATPSLPPAPAVAYTPASMQAKPHDPRSRPVHPSQAPALPLETSGPASSLVRVSSRKVQPHNRVPVTIFISGEQTVYQWSRHAPVANLSMSSNTVWSLSSSGSSCSAAMRRK